MLSSSKAEEILLREENDDGSFLVRPSESTEGDFTISVKYATLIMLWLCLLAISDTVAFLIHFKLII